MINKTLNLGVVLFSALICVTSPAFSTEKSPPSSEQTPQCKEFHRIFSDRIGEGFRELSGLAKEDSRAGMTITSAARNNENLYLSISLRNGVQKYKGIVQIYPDVELILLAQAPANDEQETPEIEEFWKSVKEIRHEKWKGGTSILPNHKYELCQSLNATIPGDEFQDGVNRKFVRHYPMGKRTNIGRKACENWNYTADQLHFYESFLPRRYDMDGVKVYWDSNYPGATTSDDFKYICNVGDYVQARAIKINSEPEKPINARIYLESKKILPPGNLETYINMTWEMQVLRNIIEGQEFWNPPNEKEEK